MIGHVLLAAVGYLMGGIPVGVLVARAHGVDLFKVGSGNIGATNVVRALGCKWGLLVWAGDVLKGIIPVFVARAVIPLESAWATAGVAAVVGHCFSPYLRLRGGKGIATSLGVLVSVDWRIGLSAFAVWLVVVGVGRIVSVGSLAAAASLLPLCQAFHDTPSVVVMTGILTCIGFIRHADNIARIIRGEEKPIGRGRHAQEPEGEEQRTE